MLKLLVLSVLVAIAAARPSVIGAPVYYSSPLVNEPVLARLGSVVKSYPTAVSHQSQSVVHSSGHVLEDVVTPAVRTYASGPVLHSYETAIADPWAYTAGPYSTYAAASPLSYAANGLW